MGIQKHPFSNSVRQLNYLLTLNYDDKNDGCMLGVTIHHARAMGCVILGKYAEWGCTNYQTCEVSSPSMTVLLGDLCQ